MKTGIALLLWLFNPMVFAATPQMHEFDYGIPLQVDGDGALYRLSLPAEVYQFTRYADMRDLMIFNGKGERVPHLLHSEQMSEREIIEVAPLRLPPHPVVPRHFEVDEKLPADDSLLDYYSGQLPLEGAGAEEYYLIDAREAVATHGTLESVQLIWDEAAPPLLAEVSIHGSDDLSQWHLLVDKQAVTQMSHQGVEIMQTRMTLPMPLKPYYRLHWPPGSGGIELQKVRFIFNAAPLSASAITIRATADEGSREGTYNYVLNGRYPVSKVQLSILQGNYTLRGKFFSRRNESNTWQLRHQGFFYDIELDGHRLISEPINIPPQRHSQWRLDVEKENRIPNGMEPELMLSWHPHQLFFIAQGEMPFTLAFGKGQLPEAELVPSALLAAVDRNIGVKSAGLGSHYELAASHALVGSERLMVLFHSVWWILPLLVTIALLGRRYFTKNK